MRRLMPANLPLLLKVPLLVLLGIVAVPLALVGIVLLVPGLIVFTCYKNWQRITGGNTWHFLRTKFKRGKTVKELARRLGVPVDELKNFEPTYRTVIIAKRSGGERQLQIPDDRTKKLQRRILRRVLARLRAHPAAHGFERGKSIATNAAAHVGQCVVVKLDIENFFPQTNAARVEAYFCRIGWNLETAKLLTRLTTHDEGLPQGAPTSPRLSNLVNYRLDVKLSSWAKKRKGQYTRYADDITFSFPKDYPKRVRGVIKKVRGVLKVLGYRLNKSKTRILRRHQRQLVTGLVVNEKLNLPRETRRRLRAAAHYLRTGRELPITESQLNGWRAYASMIQQQAGPPPASS